MSDKTKFEGQLKFFADASLWYQLPTLIGITFLLGFLTFPNPLEFPVVSLMFVIIIIVDMIALKVLITKRKNKD
ncbi:MAG: hypothetical protein ACRC1D_05230 [Culicoidibacterales bacterium]